MKNITLFICRHGETNGNLVTDLKLLDSETLNKNGVKHAKQIAKHILKSKIIPKIIFTSPLQRAQETAEIISKIVNIPIIIDWRLKEYDFGVFKGKVISNKKIYKHLTTAEDRFNFRLGEGESDADVVKRIADFITELTKQDAIIITHNYPVFVCKNLLEGKTANEIMHLKFQTITQGNCITIKL